MYTNYTHLCFACLIAQVVQHSCLSATFKTQPPWNSSIANASMSCVVISYASLCTTMRPKWVIFQNIFSINFSFAMLLNILHFYNMRGIKVGNLWIIRFAEWYSIVMLSAYMLAGVTLITPVRCRTFQFMLKHKKRNIFIAMNHSYGISSDANGFFGMFYEGFLVVCLSRRPFKFTGWNQIIYVTPCMNSIGRFLSHSIVRFAKIAAHMFLLV